MIPRPSDNGSRKGGEGLVVEGRAWGREELSIRINFSLLGLRCSL